MPPWALDDEVGDEGGCDEAGGGSAPCDFVREDLVIDVDVGTGDAEGEEGPCGEDFPIEADVPEGGDEEDAGEEFNEEVARGDAGAAVGAAAEEDEP